MNMLLAVFYTQFHARFQETIEDFVDERNSYLIEKFESLDKDNKGYLNKNECYLMFNELHHLDNQRDS